MTNSWSGWYWHLGLVSLLGMGGAIASDCVQAQIAPDTTLGAESSVVTPQTPSPVDVISGGATRGTNLFHSFEQLSVQTGRTAFFNNAADIQNIISRVTGSSSSNIDGLIRANGAANLFLLNPNGIIFGRNARLDIGGSFVASTANSIKFADGVEFNAKTSQTTPLLTVNVPIGLHFGGNPGSIQVQGDGQGRRTTSDLIDTTTGLRVPFNQTLAVVGGDLGLEGATLKTAGGRIELGSVAGEGLVNIAPIEKGFALSYEGIQNLGNIQSQQSAVDASGAGGGDIQVAGKRIVIANGSQIEASTLGAEAGGALVVKATDLLEISSTSSVFSILGAFVYPGATGNGGDLTINTSELRLQGRAQVSATTFGSGKGGNLTINANKVQLIGTTFGNEVANGLYAQADRGSTGNAGNLTINTRQLLTQGRAIVSTSTLSSGKGGDLTITSDTVQLTGVKVDNRIGSGGLFASTDGTGDAGNLTINTQQLLIKNAAQVFAGTASAGKGGNLTVNADTVQLIGEPNNGLFVQANPGATGDAGNLTINTQQLLIQGGSQVSASTVGSGRGGNLTVNADTVQLVGSTTDGRFSSGLFTQATGATGDAGDLRINTQQLLIQGGAQVSASAAGAGKGGNLTVNADRVQLVSRTTDGRARSGLFTSSRLGSTGAAGTLTINTRLLLVQDEAIVTVRSQGQGIAGNLNVNAHSIRLDNQASLVADTRSNSPNPNQLQATITLRAKDLTLLRHGSNITANATGNNVIGGNINIDTDVLVALENSDIRANSTDFRGGRVTIEASGIFGTQFRNAPTPESDITATGASPDFSGTVELNILDIDPSQGLVELPINLVDASQQIAQGCTPRGEQTSSFVATGRGGLPDNPSEMLNSDAIEVNLVTLNPKPENRSSPTVSMNPTAPAPAPIVEAQGWVIGKNGEVILTALAPTVTPLSSGLTPKSCGVPRAEEKALMRQQGN